MHHAAMQRAPHNYATTQQRRGACLCIVTITVSTQHAHGCVAKHVPGDPHDDETPPTHTHTPFPAPQHRHPNPVRQSTNSKSGMPRCCQPDCRLNGKASSFCCGASTAGRPCGRRTDTVHSPRLMFAWLRPFCVPTAQACAYTTSLEMQMYV